MNKDHTIDRLEEPLSLEREFLLLNRRNLKRFPVPVIIMIGSIALFAYDDAPKSIVLIWFCASVFFILMRAFIIVYLVPSTEGAFSTHPAKSDQEKINIIAMINFINGLCAGASLYFFFFMPDFERAFHTLLIFVLAIGTTANNVGYRKAYLPYVIVTLIPLSIALIFSPTSSEEEWKYILLGVQWLIFFMAIYSMGNDSFRLFKNSIDLRAGYAEVNKKLEVALSESEASNSAKTRFLASASHDLRQPIQSLSLFSAALQSRPLDDRSKEIVQSMDRSIQIVNKQLETLLDMSKLDAGVIKPNLQIIDISKLVKFQVEQFEPLAKSKGLTLSIASSGPAYINTDTQLFERILNNLIGNAIKYTHEGSVVIRLSKKDEQLTIDIEDSGIGIDETEIKMVYEEFYQVSNPHRDRSEGLGLGLSIVKRLARLLEMNIEIDSVLNRGTTVSLTMPLKEVASSQNVALTNSTEVDGLQNINVLVVDDEEDILLAVKNYLESLHSHAYLSKNISDAVNIAKQQPIDLLITDLRLKDNENGTDCILAVREVHPDLPAIILSGDTAPDRLQEAEKSDALFLHKPINGERFKTAIIKTMRSQGLKPSLAAR